MSLETVLSKVREKAEKADVSKVGFLAVQVNLSDCDPGVFYVEVKDHKVNVEPYDYHDRNCAFTINSDDFNKLIDGKLDPIVAFTTGKLKIDGDIEKALEFSKLLK
ncbi:MAG: SCP2 sterol-binding domain-containing protein [Butyrivibrio sp.]|nr:SCP2 sterol-binding domain-containing protein [Butyrivibrio sp.]